VHKLLFDAVFEYKRPQKYNVFKDLGDLYLKNRKIGNFGKVLFKTLLGGQDVVPKTAVQTFSFLAIFPVELN